MHQRDSPGVLSKKVWLVGAGVGVVALQPHIHPVNQYVTELLRTIEARYSDDSSRTTMAEWICKNTKLKKKPFSFKGFEFQERIINDMHPDLCCTKISQIGLSESQIRKYLAFLRRTTAVTGIYTMPDDKMRDRMSQTRVKPIIDSEAVFNPPVSDKPVRQKGLYQIGDSFGYFTGSTEGDATSIAADILIHDELDLTDQAMIALFQSRLQGSSYKISQKFGTPTYHGFGIDAAYSASDQFEYFIRCPSCRQHQLPEFHPKFICFPDGPQPAHEDLTALSVEQINPLVVDAAYWRCERCSKPLDLADPLLREWVARYPGRASRGYKVRPTSIDRITIPYIFRQLKRYHILGNLKGFHNTVLGEAFNDGNARISEDDITSCMGSPALPTPDTTTPYFLGIDMGTTCHITMGTFDRVVLFLQVPRSEVVEKTKYLLNNYRIISGCSDRYPYTPTSEEIRDLPGFEGVVMPIHYSTQSNAPPLMPGKDEFDAITHWQAHRTRTLDFVHRSISAHRVTLEGYGAHRQLIIKHLRNMVRVENEDVPPIWQKLGDEEDHFFHSLGYLFLAQRLVDASLYRSTAEVRTQVLLTGVGSSQPLGLSAKDLNKVRHVWDSLTVS
jgi:hypothetical protein